MSWLRRAFVGAAAAWPVALLLAPAAAARPYASGSTGYAFALAVYAAGSLICHQRPERSFHLAGVPLPVCARCLGIYLGAALVSVLVAVLGSGIVAIRPATSYPPLLSGSLPDLTAGGDSTRRTVLLISALPIAATLLVEWTTGHTPGNWTRAASGVPLGGAIAWLVCSRHGR
ncbi:MAG: DUF2085 domain-containing protein [Acidobacteriota bacterium]